MQSTLSATRLRSEIESQGTSISRLAKSSGVSRAQIHRLLRGDQTRVQDSTLHRLAAALKTAPASLRTGGALDCFREWVAKEHEFVNFRGLGIHDLQPQPLERIFVEPDVVEERSLGSEEECETGARSRWADPVSRSPVPATKAIETRDRVVVIGDPGSGKTTLLRWLAHKHAAGHRKRALVPVYIRLPEFMRALEIDKDADIIKFVASKAAARGCEDLDAPLGEAFTKQKCLVLLDGLDEVGGSDETGTEDRHAQLDRRGQLLEAVLKFVDRHREHKLEHQFVVSSRIVGFDPGPWVERGFSVLRIRPYREEKQEQAAAKWAKILSETADRSEDEILKSLKIAISSNERVRSLASNPLILTILIRLNEARGGTLPRRRVDLYAKVVDVFLDEWERSKRSTDTFEETVDIDLDGREFRWLLSALALMMQKADRTLAPRWWIADRMGEYLQQQLMFTWKQARDASDRIIRYLAERTGLIEERGLDLCGFSHRTLQEYFASLGAIDEADASRSRDVTECLRPFYYREQWSEVIRLVAAQLTPTLAEALIAGLCDDPDPVGRFLKRGPLLALRCLSDGTTIPSRRRVQDIFESLHDLGRSKWLGLTLEAVDVLEDFKGTRLERLAQATIDSIVTVARSELTDDDFDCLIDRIRVSEIVKGVEAELSSGWQGQAAREVEVTVDGKRRRIVCFNASLRREKPDAWIENVCSLMQDEQKSEEFKLLLIRETGRFAASDGYSRHVLRKILDASSVPALRAAAANALATANGGVKDRKPRLLCRFESDDDERVRAACAASLRRAAARNRAVRDALMHALEADTSTTVRAGAACGLSDAAAHDRAVRDALLHHASAVDWPKELRRSCAWALEDQIGRDQAVTSTFKSWLETPDAGGVQRVAAQSLAHAMASEVLAWDHHVVEQVQYILMNLDKPCPHALESLEALADARERRRGLRLEGVLRESLAPLSDRIDLAFVFGSTARGKQVEESDIDLMLIGHVTLKDLASPLREAERILGKRVSPVIYTLDSFRQKYERGDPFLTEVCRREKIPIARSGSTLSRDELDDELRAMVAERMDPAQ